MILVLLGFACATMHATPADAAPIAPTYIPTVKEIPAPVGSLWSDVQGRQSLGLGTNARRIGDMVTVLVEENDSTSVGASTNTARDTSAGFGIETLLGLETSVVKANPNMSGGLNIAGSSSSSTDGTGATSRNGALNAVITCFVTEVLPNGDLRLHGTKQITVNHEHQFLVLEGVARTRDIRLDNTVKSTLLGDLKTEFSGQGVIANQQGQGWGTAVANTIWPF